MNREIKFRAWLKDAETMVDVCIIDWNDKYIVHEDLAIPFISAPEPPEPECVTYLKDCELMQFTGLKDKNFKEIWEGDVVRHSNMMFDVIYWNEHALFCLRATGTYPWVVNDWVGCEVIGNIYETPELMENK